MGLTGLSYGSLGIKLETEGVMPSPGFSLRSGRGWVGGTVREHWAWVLIPPHLSPVPCKGTGAQES